MPFLLAGKSFSFANQKKTVINSCVFEAWEKREKREKGNCPSNISVPDSGQGAD